MIYDPSVWLKNYDPGVDAEVKIQGRSLHQIFEEMGRQFADRPAVNYLGMRMNYRELAAWADRFARGLSERGLGKGDVVALHMPNLPHYVIALAGTLKAGCIVSGLSPLFTPDELEYQLQDSGAKALVSLDMLFDNVFSKIADRVEKVAFVLKAGVFDFLSEAQAVSGDASAAGMEVMPFVDFCRAYPPEAQSADVRRDDPAFLLYTGGTTGRPKGAVLTHGNMLANLAQFDVWLGLERGTERNLAAFPMFHAAGNFICCATLYIGGEQTLIPNPRDLNHVIQEWGDLKPTWGIMSPSLYTMLMNEESFHQLDFSSMKGCFSGSAPFSVEGMNAVEALVGKGKVTEGLAMTECSPVFTANPVKGRKKVGSVGVPIPSTLVKIMDLETGDQEMPLGETGEIIVHGPQVMKGYHNKPEETAHALREHDGKLWMHTGDVGYMDEDGYIWVVDRLKDMVVVGGYKVFSTEVEGKFYQHPAVMFCAIIGVPHPDRPGSELVKLVVQKSEDYLSRSDEEVEEELTAFAREKLAPYKVPKIIEIVEAMPLTAVGKVNKKALRV
jgi:acyl-CoA synthetase (AMP-forming)/AMP-acid ligase II